MADHAVSDHPGVQAQLDRLASLSPGVDTLGLSRITRLLARLGDPQRRLPPVFHVAGTNGKGSTCAFLRAMMEAAGHRVHVYTSPHLVRFNERIRIAGALIEDDTLAALLAEVLDAADGIGASFFEVTTAAAFLAFARTPAAATILEVGLGGRLDATNVVPYPVSTGIAALGIDHEAFLLAPEAGTPTDPIARIAFEKAGIARADVPLVTLTYPPQAMEAIGAVVARKGARWQAQGAAWTLARDADRFTYRDADAALDLPVPTLPGPHQVANAALAVAMVRHQRAVPIDEGALADGITGTAWPARMQRLAPGPLTALVGDTPLWLDGGHNPSAGEALAASIAPDSRPTLVFGMLASKDAAGWLAPFASRLDGAVAVPVGGHASHTPDALAAIARAAGVGQVATADDLAAALRIAADWRRGGISGDAVLIAGSLYLAGDALRRNDQYPR